MDQRLMAPPPAANISQQGSTVIPQYQHCIEACLQCFEACEQMIVQVSHEENADPNLIRLLNDAVEISQVSATFMLRGSNFHIRTCAVCAEVCKVCAEACEKAALHSKNELLKSCADVLRVCAESCYQMAHHH